MFIPIKSLSSAPIPSQVITSSLVVGITVLEIIDPTTYIMSGNQTLPPPENRAQN